MFDAPTSDHIDMTAAVVSLNLRAVYESDALGILMICAAAWLRRAVDRDDGVKRILVVDEAWAVLARLEAARWLLSDSETKVIFRQAPGELALVRELCQLSERETAIVASLPKGSALWKVGQRSFQVEHQMSAWEREITYTDERMRLVIRGCAIG
jgi:hypothetical protein